MKPGRILLLPLVILATLPGGGCSKPDADRPVAASSGKFYAVSASSTPFFRYGPQQGGGPDQSLERDTLVTVIRPSFGYCKVKLSSGEAGYVASDDIKPAPENLVATVTKPEMRSEVVERFTFESNDPELAAPPEDLPEKAESPE